MQIVSGMDKPAYHLMMSQEPSGRFHQLQKNEQSLCSWHNLKLAEMSAAAGIADAAALVGADPRLTGAPAMTAREQSKTPQMQPSPLKDLMSGEQRTTCQQGWIVRQVP